MAKKKSVDDYLTEGMYGLRRPKEAEREHYLGTLRERIVLALTKGQVMTDAHLKDLEEAIKQHPETKLIFNGDIANRFFKKEKAIADKHSIPYSVITNKESSTDIGAVLTYDYAVHIENIFVQSAKSKKSESKQKTKTPLLTRLKNWFK